MAIEKELLDQLLAGRDPSTGGRDIKGGALG
jgi:hypothetical protein